LLSFSGCGVFQVTLRRGYKEGNFKEDLKKLYHLVGVDRKATVFLFTATQFAEEGKFIQNSVYCS
jgi:dynein heavy chain